MPTFATQNGEGRAFSREGYNATVAAGARRSSPIGTRMGWADALRKVIEQKRKEQQQSAPFLGGQAERFIPFANTATQGAADLATADFRRQVGGLLGSLNSIGALRSGGVQAGLNELTTEFSRNVGSIANANVLRALGMAQQEHDLEVERAFRERQYRDAKRRSKGSLIGKIVGGALGFAVGGPAGAVMGAKAGGSIG